MRATRRSDVARGVQPMIAVCGHKLNTSQEQVVRSIQSMGGTAIALVGDLGDPDVPSRTCRSRRSRVRWSGCVGRERRGRRPGAMCDLSADDWEYMFSVNLRGAWLLAKASYAHLKDSRGAACFASSMSGQLPHAGSGAYSPSKAALTMLAQTLALEWAPDGIRVNVVSPGMTHTPMTEKMYADPQIKRAREKIVPLGRIGDPMDIANVIEFLVSPLSGYVTGQDICVDGGFSSLFSAIFLVDRAPAPSWRDS